MGNPAGLDAAAREFRCVFLSLWWVVMAPPVAGRPWKGTGTDAHVAVYGSGGYREFDGERNAS